MKNNSLLRKTLKLTAGAAAALLLVPLLLPPRKDRTRLLPLDAIVKAASLEIQSPSGQILLAKRDGRWQMLAPYQFTANGEFVESFISVMAETNLSGELTSFTDDLQPFGLGPEDGTSRLKVKYADSRTALDMIFSAKGPDYIPLVPFTPRSVFVTPAGETEVREAIGMSPKVFTLPPEAWVSKKAAEFDPADVVSLTVAKGEKSVTIRFMREEYLEQSSLPIKKEQAGEALSAVSALPAAATLRVCPSCENKILPQAEETVSIAFRNTPPVTLNIGAGNEKRPVWTTGRENELYIVDYAALAPALSLVQQQ